MCVCVCVCVSVCEKEREGERERWFLFNTVKPFKLYICKDTSCLIIAQIGVILLTDRVLY